MTSQNIRDKNKQVFLANGPSVLYRKMREIQILIKNKRYNHGILKLEDVLIVPNLDKRLFSINLLRGINWVHFELGIQDGLKVKIPLISLQTNIMVVNTISNCHLKRSHPPDLNDTQNRRTRIYTNTIHDRFHR